jgi:hypothetical protein
MLRQGRQDATNSRKALKFVRTGFPEFYVNPLFRLKNDGGE